MHADVPALSRRPAIARDVAFLETLYRSTRDDLLQLGLPEAVLGNLLRMQFNAQQQGYRAQFPDGDYVILEKDGEPAGYLVTHHAHDAIRLVYIALLPHERNRGHGRRLLQALQTSATAAQKSLTLSVSAQNEPAIRLYLSLGFQIQKNDEAHLEMIWTPDKNR